MRFNEVVIENLKLWILYGFPTVPKADEFLTETDL